LELYLLPLNIKFTQFILIRLISLLVSRCLSCLFPLAGRHGSETRLLDREHFLVFPPNSGLLGSVGGTLLCLLLLLCLIYGVDLVLERLPQAGGWSRCEHHQGEDRRAHLSGDPRRCATGSIRLNTSLSR
jgi:hypothetical protein